MTDPVTSPDVALLGVTNEIVGVLEVTPEIVTINVEAPEVITIVVDNSAKSGTTYLASYGDATPVIIFNVPAGQAVDKIDIEVLETWDGDGATVRLGTLTDPGKFFDTAPVLEVELTALAIFSKDFQELGPLQILLSVNPGITPTQGKIRVQISTTPQGN
jgi:hypothetical protein